MKEDANSEEVASDSDDPDEVASDTDDAEEAVSDIDDEFDLSDYYTARKTTVLVRNHGKDISQCFCKL